MLNSVEGFWISASVFRGDFSNSYFHFFPAPGADIYATISLSEVNPWGIEPQLSSNASAYIDHWTAWDPDGNHVAPEPNSMGHTQNAVMVRNCGSLDFSLDVSNGMAAVAQINIFRF